MKNPTAVILVFLMFVLLGLGGAAAEVETQAEPCGAPEADHFDFWLGQWDVYAKGNLVGHNRIGRILGGCTLFEEYQASGGKFEGKSFNYFDGTDGRWHQVWVDNGGVRLHLVGGLQETRMVLSGQRVARGKAVTDRISWTPNDDGTVRQLWELSSDNGESWQVLFDGLYKPVVAGAEGELK